jgi:hypothetical protein
MVGVAGVEQLLEQFDAQAFDFVNSDARSAAQSKSREYSPDTLGLFQRPPFCHTTIFGLAAGLCRPFWSFREKLLHRKSFVQILGHFFEVFGAGGNQTATVGVLSSSGGQAVEGLQYLAG